MQGRNRKSRQLDMYEVPMNKFIDLQHELVIAGNRIDWNSLENNFRSFYSDKGRPSVPVRKIIGLLLLKSRFGISEEKALDIWIENPYWQFFCGEVHFQKDKPFSIGEFSRFKRRVGSKGLEKIHLISTEYFGIGEEGTYKSYSDLRKQSFWQRLFHN